MLLNEIKKVKTHLEYHQNLNQKIWNKDDILHDDVKKALENISNAFLTFLKITPDKVVDVIITGSNANYNWSKMSDIDLHIVLSYSAICKDCENGSGFDLNDCFEAKKNLWNERHEITVRGHDVELYVQPSLDEITGNAGVFSLSKNEWVKKPTKEEDLVYDKRLIESKAKELMDQIDSLQTGSSEEDTKRLMAKIKKMRQAGLASGGEFSLENLVFKTLRNNGYMDKLYKLDQEIQDKDLSLK